MRGRRLRILATAATAGLLLSGCGAQQTERPQLTVFAAASLTASFTELAEEFSSAHPDVDVAPLLFDGSSTLGTQLNEGAPADVFASADLANMAKVTALVDGTPEVFATNILQIAVAPGNPREISGLADLARSDLQVVLCAPEVPCGTASHQLLDLGGVSVVPVSEELNVKAVLTKVQAGEADAGLVYVTDVAAAGGAVDGVNVVGAERAANEYPIAALRQSQNPAVAQAFIDFVLSARGQQILAEHGFTAS